MTLIGHATAPIAEISIAISVALDFCIEVDYDDAVLIGSDCYKAALLDKNSIHTRISL